MIARLALLLLVVGAASRPCSKASMEAAARAALEDAWLVDEAIMRPFVDAPPVQVSVPALLSTMGMARHHVSTAKRMFGSLLAVQWKNGLLPHASFNDSYTTTRLFLSKGDLPAAALWASNVSAEASTIRTSGLATLPLHATAALHIYNNTRTFDEGSAFLSSVYPQLLKYHKYLTTGRVLPARPGLVYIWHPWEAGSGYNPAWDALMSGIPVSNSSGQLPHIPASVRGWEDYPGDYLYTRMLAQLLCGRAAKYADDAIRHDCSPFVVYSVAFNAALLRYTQDLYAIGKLLGADSADLGHLSHWMDVGAAGLNTLFNSSHTFFFDKAAPDGSSLATLHASGLTPLWSLRLHPNMAEALLDKLVEPTQFGSFLPVPSTPVSAPHRRGSPSSRAVSPLFNLLLSLGLAQHGFHGLAYFVGNRTLDAACANGFALAYNASTGGVAVAVNSTASAAATLALLLPGGTAPADPPLNSAASLLVAILELVFVGGVGITCIFFGVYFVRRVLREEREGMFEQYQEFEEEDSSDGEAEYKPMEGEMRSVVGEAPGTPGSTHSSSGAARQQTWGEWARSFYA